MREHRYIYIVIIMIHVLHLNDASVTQQPGDLTSLDNTTSKLLNVMDNLISKDDLVLALQLVAELMDGAVSTWSTDQTQTTFINTSFVFVNNLIDLQYKELWKDLQLISLVDCIIFLENVQMFGYDISSILRQSDNTSLEDIELENIKVNFKKLPINGSTQSPTSTSVEATLALSTIATDSKTEYKGETLISYKTFENLLTTSSKRLFKTHHYVISKLVSYSVSPTSNELSIPIQVEDGNRNTPNWTCGFVINKPNDSVWSIEGINKTSENETTVTCLFNHHGTFAVLGCIPPSLPWQVKTALAISILIIIFVFIVLVYVNRLYFSDIIILVLCILVTLFFEQIFIVSGAFAVCNRHTCKAMALIIHFFDLSIFFWIFGQSVQIALKISYVTMESGGIMQYCALGWITPAFIVASAVGLVQGDYENGQYCAVSKTSHASLGPIVCVVVCNYICLVYLIYGYNYIRRSDNKAYAVIRTTKCSIIANGIIVTLMFISWSLWTSAIDEQTNVYYWLWAISVLILGSSVLLFYGVYNPEVRSEILRRFGRISAVQDGSVVGRAARSQHQLNEAIRLSQIIENSVVREQDSVVGGVDCDQITNDSTISLTQTMTSTLQRVGFRKSRLGPSTANAKSSEGTTSNIGSA
ncbi:adhesion G protein-coupled receptor L3-like [Anneissia japonica]|uniref:adhesion G protein-coupled receptor L3-like n=1 Tax=Anneissia japonica TaxID=1529436 RepID=UPI001425879B|nr:adhesion G protein-coupled receptor L3-like [Anneissia japonica]